jgi:L-alanine-DL-glutamate epimerase-like enolase superfamily enzyme
MKIKEIEIIWLDVPFHEVPQRNMERSYNGWHISEICRVTADNGLVGYGETLPHYTWGKVTPEAVAYARGKSPFDLMWDDTLGAGLQMALFDLAGKAAGVPVYRLLGKKCRDQCPIAWWGIDMSPEDYASEARQAVAQGYTSFKQKARPWYDVYEQVRQTMQVIPPYFKLDYDFNELLLNASNAIPVLKRLEQCPNMAMFESPILHMDIEGVRKIRQQISVGIALHYNFPLITAVRQDVYDGFVSYESPNKILRLAGIAQEANMPFWLQMVGTAWTTALAMHLGAVCTHAQWPAVTCMNMYVDQLVTKPLEVKGGYIRVPEEPGLGIEFNEASLKWRVNSSDKPNVEALYAFVGPDGSKTWYTDEQGKGSYWTDFVNGSLPLFERGVSIEQWTNDGTPEWRELAARVREAPVRSFSEGPLPGYK